APCNTARRASFASKQILQPKRDRVSGHAGASPRRKGDPGLYAANATVGGISTSYTTLRWREVVVDDEQDAKAIDMALPQRAAR
ncbi:hypothetical protein, partial [Burkholderia ubonensis]|uniref:hypothetical protein n=1 Tax=Burkholderia ubonensis TaxID=101571 RepID=UPI001E418EA2